MNWLNWPKTNNLAAFKKKLRECQRWDAYKINVYSISLLVCCEFMNCLGNIWVYYLCMNFGILESVLSILKGILILGASVPLSLDLCFTILQRVNPSQLGYIIEDKLKKLGYTEGIIKVRQWHLWCLDKSYRICSLHVEVTEQTDTD